MQYTDCLPSGGCAVTQLPCAIIVALRVDNVASSNYAMGRASIRQRKTDRPVRIELTDQTRSAVDDDLRVTRRKPGQFSCPLAEAMAPTD